MGMSIIIFAIHLLLGEDSKLSWLCHGVISGDPAGIVSLPLSTVTVVAINSVKHYYYAGSVLGL